MDGWMDDGCICVLSECSMLTDVDWWLIPDYTVDLGLLYLKHEVLDDHFKPFGGNLLTNEP
jgi:hypothetical protein